ncbi:apolipoprotein N-acyltransferase [Aurantivibrio infirmus]
MRFQTIHKHQPFFALLAAASSGALLALSSLFPQLFVLAWVAFVPLLLALRHTHSLAQAYRLGLCTGIVLYVLSTYWMVDFIQLLNNYSLALSVSLAAVYWLYCAQMIALITVLNQYCRRSNSGLWVFAIIVSGVFAFYPTLFSVQVGETQSEFLIALQGIEFTGVHGLDFIVALVNGLIAQAILSKNYFAKRSVGIAYTLVFLWFGYGAWSLPYWHSVQKNASTLKVGMVQANQPPSTKPSAPHPGFSRTYPLEMAMAEQLIEHQVDLLVWPEMRTRDYYDREFVREAYRKRVNAWQTPLIFQDREFQRDADGSQQFNTATLLNENGELAGQYRKMQLIPVAEYLPWVGGFSSQTNKELKRWLRREFGSFFTDFTAGSKPEYFDTNEAVIIPLICYEVMFPNFVAKSVANASTNQNKKGRLLLAQSNNSWFGDTRQPYQHLAASVLRSVENRLPFVHAVNNGPGAVVLPSGEKLFQSAYRETSAYVVDVPLIARPTSENASWLASIFKNESGNTFYSRHPNLFLIFITVAFGFVLIRTWFAKPNESI